TSTASEAATSRSDDRSGTAANRAAPIAGRSYPPSCRWNRQRGRSCRSSGENVAVERIEGAAALLGDVGFRSRRLAEKLAQRRAGGPGLLHLHLLGDLADLGRHGLGVLVTSLQLIGDLRRNSTLGGMALDIADHLLLGLAVVADQLAGFVRRGVAVARGLEH